MYPGRSASSSVLTVPKNRSILPRPWGAGDGGMDQPDVEVDGGAGELVADEVAAVIDVEHVR